MLSRCENTGKTLLTIPVLNWFILAAGCVQSSIFKIVTLQPKRQSPDSDLSCLCEVFTKISGVTELRNNTENMTKCFVCYVAEPMHRQTDCELLFSDCATHYLLCKKIFLLHLVGCGLATFKYFLHNDQFLF